MKKYVKQNGGISQVQGYNTIPNLLVYMLFYCKPIPVQDHNTDFGYERKMIKGHENRPCEVFAIFLKTSMVSLAVLDQENRLACFKPFCLNSALRKLFSKILIIASVKSFKEWGST